MKFIDLFAGLGGFHEGLVNAGHECVFASELDPKLKHLYKENHGLEPHGDITKIHEKSIPTHDIMCAGFPCQPFSLAGQKKGAKCPSSGKLIDHVVRIAKHHKPKYIILENVPNILTIENGKFWEYLQRIFSKINYKLKHKIISPLDFGIPQNRKRVFIIACKNKKLLNQFKWPIFQGKKQSLLEVLDAKLPHKTLEDKKQKQILKWQELLTNIKQSSIMSISLAAPEFGATYPINFEKISLNEMRRYKGSYGCDLSQSKSWEDLLTKLPNYTRKNKKVPDWLLRSINYSRNVYKENSNFLDAWKQSLNKENNSWQILEWRGEKNNLDLHSHIIQFRASGLRVLKTLKAPSLIAMTPTQIPIITSEMRYISEHEAAKLQGLENLKMLSERTSAFKALGNAVNAKIVTNIACSLL